VFANAGITTLTTLGTITEADYDSLFNANVKGRPVHGAGGTSTPDEGGIERHKGSRAVVRPDNGDGLEGSRASDI
jgi:hypothetical protein